MQIFQGSGCNLNIEVFSTEKGVLFNIKEDLCKGNLLTLQLSTGCR